MPLSIGGRVLVEDDDEFSAAIRCAAALDLTAQALAVMSGKASGPEVAQIRRAEEYFLKRAVEQSAPDSAATVDAAVARQRAERADDVAGQAQLAIACLRRVGGS